MKKLFWITIVIASLAAFFASTNPDGLDFVSEKLGFADKGQEHSAPMAGYKIPFLPGGGTSTALAGIVGIFIVLALFRLPKSFLICLIGALFAVSPAFAARPLITDDFYTVIQGGYELEAGYASTQNQASPVKNANLSFKRGILPNFDLGIEVPYTLSAPAGLNDVLLHAKYRLWERGADEGLTGRVDFKFNNGNINKGLGSGDNDYCLLFIYSKMFGLTKAHLNLGYVNVGINAGIQTDDYFAYTCAFEHPVWGEKGEIAAEYVANGAAAPNPAFIQFAARYIIRSGFKLDIGYSFGLDDKSIKNSLTAGAHCEF